MMRSRSHFGKVVLLGLFIAGFGLTLFVSRFAVEAAIRQNDVDMIAELDGPLMLGPGQTRITLKPVATKGTEGKTLASRLATLAPGRRIYVVLRDLRAGEQPGVLYRLYLDLPRSEKSTRGGSQHAVGTLNFFNAPDAGGFNTGNPKNARFFSYDITDIARQLHAQDLLCSDTTLTIIPSGTPTAGSKASIGRVELIEQ